MDGQGRTRRDKGNGSYDVEIAFDVKFRYAPFREQNHKNEWVQMQTNPVDGSCIRRYAKKKKRFACFDAKRQSGMQKRCKCSAMPNKQTGVNRQMHASVLKRRDKEEKRGLFSTDVVGRVLGCFQSIYRGVEMPDAFFERRAERREIFVLLHVGFAWIAI